MIHYWLGQASKGGETNMKRLYKLATTVLVIGAIGWTTCAFVPVKTSPNSSHNTYMVHGNDTLWGIVTSNHRYGGKDPREVVYEIQKLNRLQGSQIQPGQVIKLP